MIYFKTSHGDRIPLSLDQAEQLNWAWPSSNPAFLSIFWWVTVFNLNPCPKGDSKLKSLWRSHLTSVTGPISHRLLFMAGRAFFVYSPTNGGGAGTCAKFLCFFNSSLISCSTIGPMQCQSIILITLANRLKTPSDLVWPVSIHVCTQQHPSDHQIATQHLCSYSCSSYVQWQATLTLILTSNVVFHEPFS